MVDVPIKVRAKVPAPFQGTFPSLLALMRTNMVLNIVKEAGEGCLAMR